MALGSPLASIQAADWAAKPPPAQPIYPITDQSNSPSVPPSAFSPPEYRVTRWTSENGLPQHSIKALLQTHDGYLWIGTLSGLVRFDGVRFTVFDHNNTPEFTHDSVDDLVEDIRDSSLWIATGRGLLNYREHRFERFGAEQSVPETAGCLCAGREGGVWFSPQEGRVALARDGKVKKWDFGADRLENAVFQIAEKSSSNLLLLVRNAGLCQFDLVSGTLTPFAGPPGDKSIRSFDMDANGCIWLCRTDGVWRRTRNGWSRVLAADSQNEWERERIHRTRDGRLWVLERHRTLRTVRLVIEDCMQPVAARDLPDEVNVTHFLEDREGNLWIGTTTGLFRLQPKHLRVYSQRDGLRNDDVQAVTQAADSTLWLGTAAGISGIRDNLVVTNLPPPQWHPDLEKVQTFLADGENRLWFSHPPTELNAFARGEWRGVRAPEKLAQLGGVQSLYQDQSHHIWIGTKSGVICQDGRTNPDAYFGGTEGEQSDEGWTYLPTNGFAHSDVRVIYQDRRGDIWFGTFGGGLSQFHEGKITSFKTDRGPHNNRMWWIHEDKDGVYWVATEDGLNRFIPPDPGKSAGQFFTFTTEHGLPDNIVNNIQEDDFGYLWLSGLRGIYRISRQQLNDVASGKRAQVECLALGEADGMLNSECNGGDNQPAGCKDRQGRIWFPTTKGVVVIDPKEVHRNEVPPPVVLEQVKANNEVIYGDGRAEKVKSGNLDSALRTAPSEIQKGSQPSTINYLLAPGSARVLEIRYTANSLVAPEKLRFQYRLQGYDNAWRDTGDRRIAFFTNLRPGNYRFEVKARTHHGVWSESPALFAFTLAPHFYETWPFYGLCALGFVGLAFGVQAYRLRVQQRILHMSHERSLERERARISRDLHDDLGASLTGIALQLEAAQKRGRAESPQLGKLAGEARSLSHDLRELAWTTNPRCDNSGSLAAFIGESTERFCRAAGLACRLDLPAQDGNLPVPARVRHELLMVLKETLANVSKHAQAGKVEVGLTLNNGELQLRISDDGRGFDTKGAFAGLGLRNMRERMEQAGGVITLRSRPGAGTTVMVTMPMGKSDVNS
jgi:signal transduction histidine kinase/ligand-binding sensor domain-containing protein